MNKVIFWDFDGTLGSADDIWYKSMHDLLLRSGYAVDYDDLWWCMSRSRSNGINIIFSFRTPEISYTDAMGDGWWETLFSKFDGFYNKFNVSADDRKRINSLYRDEILDSRNYFLLDGAENALRQCVDMGWRNYILSNNYPELPEVIKSLGIGELITDYIVSGNVGYEKPRIELFDFAKKLAGYPDECYMIGDNPIADIKGGNAAGMKTILVHTEESCGADFYAAKLAAIPSLLRKIHDA